MLASNARTKINQTEDATANPVAENAATLTTPWKQNI
jgi:hypothetical protein